MITNNYLDLSILASLGSSVKTNALSELTTIPKSLINDLLTKIGVLLSLRSTGENFTSLTNTSLKEEVNSN